MKLDVARSETRDVNPATRRVASPVRRHRHRRAPRVRHGRVPGRSLGRRRRRAPHGARLRDRLITRDTFGDFELEFEWRVAPGGNSGVIYRVVETAEPAWTTGPEYQVLDDEQHPDGRDPTTSAAALYDLIAPATNKRLEPVGSFNVGRIVVRDGRVEHWLNGELVVTFGWNDPAVRDLVAASKFAGSRVSWLPSPATSCSSTMARRPCSGISGSDRGALTRAGRQCNDPAWHSMVPASLQQRTVVALRDRDHGRRDRSDRSRAGSHIAADLRLGARLHSRRGQTRSP